MGLSCTLIQDSIQYLQWKIEGVKLQGTYKYILKLSFPIMLGTAAQSIVALSDSIFLYHLSEQDFAAIGFVGVFYLVIAGIGFGFTRGGQLMIARRMGESKQEEVGRTFYAMLYFEIILATIMFFFLRYGASAFFELFVSSKVILLKSVEYLHYRAYGLFFSFTGVAIIALYTSVARPSFIVIDTVILAVSNLILNYLLVFGKFGFPAMGIGGSALASTLSEALAFFVFVIYILFDKPARKYRLFHLPNIDLPLMVQQLRLALPAVVQTVIGLGSWFVFVSMIESLGQRPLAITNLVRIVYLILIIPCWGFSSGMHTLVSNLLGQKKFDEILPLAWKTAILSLSVTLILAIPMVIWPHYLLYPLLGEHDNGLFADSVPTFRVLLVIMCLYSTANIFFNVISGTGATYFGLKLQAVLTAFYLFGVFYVVKYTDYNVAYAWGVEIFYWIFLFVFSYWFLRSNYWHTIEV